MRRLFVSQVFVYLPSLIFLAILAGVFFLQSEKDFAATPALETLASDIVWERHTPDGRMVRLSTLMLRKGPDDSLSFEDVYIENSDWQDSFLFGRSGSANKSGKAILLQDGNGEFLTQDGRVTMMFDSVNYSIDRPSARGEALKLSWQGNRISGDTFILEQGRIQVKGGVNALYFEE